ncbi:hypothetical protein [Nocardia transvalensis]|uniref:hypothetical protein n=1 Tax=Nocardia transvalensis TaxID=37333 RepID=UPI0018955AC3|nr:hypothetical protein [Nocardia transvalensis]MBF6333771.1 hypothetical protein [Nocardia transvalensis]
MSDESTQLSVAELLARNGQGVPTSGGGRRRRGGRGIAVTDLTGDLPAVPEGSSAHAAPDPEEPAPVPLPDFQLSSDVEPSYSPLSGPITFYDPLASASAAAAPVPTVDPPSFEPVTFEPATFEPPAFEPPQFEPPSYEPRSYSSPALPDSALRDPSALGRPEPPSNGIGSVGAGAHGAPEADRRDPLAGRNGAGLGEGRRARRERLEAMAGGADQVSVADLQGAPPTEQPAPPRSGRRRRRDPDDETTEVRPYRGPLPQTNGDEMAHPATAWAPSRRPDAGPRAPMPPNPPAAPPRRDRAPERPDRGEPGAPPRNGRRNGADGPPPPGLPAWSARRRPSPEPPNSDRPARNGRPAPDDATGAATAAWSLANRDQQLLAGPTVAGDLLRDANERGDRRGRAPWPGERDTRRGGTDVLDDTEHRTEVFRPLGPDPAEPEDEEKRDRPTRQRAGTRTAARRSRTSRKAEDDANRRQWMILGGQAAGAAVAGMLLFKGFEKMWDLLPFVALCLAMVVILGLVALVRVLRRTDDIFSTVIAVVVGIFVTLGPLAFLLSTN